MAKIVQLAVRRPSAESVDALAAQLGRLEEASSPDAATMDAINQAAQRVLAALANAGSNSFADVVLKLTAVVRRASRPRTTWTCCGRR